VRLGLTIPTFGPLANAENIVAVARNTEGMGYESLWSGDRTLAPVSPRDRYTQRPQLPGDGLRLIRRLDVPDGDIDAVLGKVTHARGTNPAAATRHQRDFAAQTVTRSTLLNCHTGR
jgi:hypothetical protein